MPLSPTATSLDPLSIIVTPLDLLSWVATPTDSLDPIATPLEPLSIVATPLDLLSRVATPTDSLDPIATPLEPLSIVATPLDLLSRLATPTDSLDPIATPLDPLSIVATPLDPFHPFPYTHKLLSLISLLPLNFSHHLAAHFEPLQSLVTVAHLFSLPLPSYNLGTPSSITTPLNRILINTLATFCCLKCINNGCIIIMLPHLLEKKEKDTEKYSFQC